MILGGLLYVLMMFAQTVGFGTDAAGIAWRSQIDLSITDLAAIYVGEWFAVVLAFCALAVALASTIGSTAAADVCCSPSPGTDSGPSNLAC